MKKITAMILSGTTAFLLAACQAPGNTQAPSSGTAPESSVRTTADSSETESSRAPEESAVQESNVSAAGFDAAAAKTYVEILCGGDASSLESTYAHTELLITELNKSGGLAGLQASLMQLGELSEIGEPIVSETAGYTSFSVPCAFSVQPLNLVINVDSNGEIAGIVTAPYEDSVAEEIKLPEGVTEISLNLPVEDVSGWELPGTLTLPEGKGPFPAVILVHGSGPNDRDETLGNNKPFRDLAWGLAQKGIAVYRYDKRTYVYGQDIAADVDFTLYEETVADAAAAISLLGGESKIDPARIFVAGHSLGGMSLPAIAETANKSADGINAAGYIFLAAPARQLSELMKEQYDFLYALTPELSDAEQAQKAQIDEQLALLENVSALEDSQLVLGAYGAYWKDLAQYDQLASAGDITQPCLVLQGEEDYQVTMEDFEAWQTTYAGQPNWTFKSYDGLTHLFMPGQKTNGPADYQVSQTLDSRVIEDISAFVAGTGKD